YRSCRPRSGADQSSMSLLPYQHRVPLRDISSCTSRRRYTGSHRSPHATVRGSSFYPAGQGTSALPACSSRSLSLFLPSQNIPSYSPLHASDTRIDAEDNHRNICQFATLKHFHKGRYIGEGGGPYPRENKML